MGSADDARLSRQWAGASGWQGALARMCPLESTLAGTDVGEAQNCSALLPARPGDVEHPLPTGATRLGW